MNSFYHFKPASKMESLTNPDARVLVYEEWDGGRWGEGSLITSYVVWKGGSGTSLSIIFRVMLYWFLGDEDFSVLQNKNSLIANLIESLGFATDSLDEWIVPSESLDIVLTNWKYSLTMEK